MVCIWLQLIECQQLGLQFVYGCQCRKFSFAMGSVSIYLKHNDIMYLEIGCGTAC
jgi:hypothetical protein